QLLRSAAFDGLFHTLTELDDPALEDDKALDAWMLSHLGTAIHMCGTAPVGPVVDGAGRVHGVSGLRVVDTSIVPVVPSRGPFATAVLLGEMLGRRIRDEG
ncbi:MAG TPA: GMC family oxidoreductase, partial [Microbacterium sp.]|nr:GMC family oxidoreductase [Microbacterium sp.]